MYGSGVEFVPISNAPVGCDAEVVFAETREDVQVSMEDLLEGGFTVRKEHVDALAVDARTTKGASQPVRDPKELPEVTG